MNLVENFPSGIVVILPGENSPHKIFKKIFFRNTGHMVYEFGIEFSIRNYRHITRKKLAFYLIT